ncbi:hypothetical protein ACFO4E_00060 [Nocardiopsis mangrovi]|uniref:Uncharacterized protein n=1 Tax=Nocardiopsis mangrovi TaxID=1179818 RepID=A0ABV9DR18_9ACTN
MDIHRLAVRIRGEVLGPASAAAVARQIEGIERLLAGHADAFGYDHERLSGEQADALAENLLAERDLPVVEADDIRDIHEAHEAGAVPHNSDITVLAVDPATWGHYAVMSAGEAEQRAFRVVYTAAQLAERLGGRELTDDLAEEISWEVTSEVSPA